MHEAGGLQQVDCAGNESTGFIQHSILLYSADSVHLLSLCPFSFISLAILGFA